MKTPDNLARELDLVHGELSTPTGSEDFLLLIGQALAAILKELHDVNSKIDQLLQPTD